MVEHDQGECLALGHALVVQAGGDALAVLPELTITAGAVTQLLISIDMDEGQHIQIGGFFDLATDHVRQDQ
ncbi:hypothetical protein D3C80_2001710 [compost metagenome]